MQDFAESPVESLSAERPTKQPKYEKLARDFVERIRLGDLKPGDRLPTFAQFHSDYGASRPTAERILGILEREGLIQRLVGSGIFVADTKKTNISRKGIIGLSGYAFGFTGVSDYWAQLLRGVQSVLDDSQQQILLLPHETNAGWEKSDGVLLYDWNETATKRLIPPGLPCVSVLNFLDDVSSVTADDYTGTRAATEHLLELGHRRIAFLHSRNQSVTPRRVAGYKDALKAAGISPHPQWLRPLPQGTDFGDQFVQVGRECIRIWLAENWSTLGCTALLAQNDEVALGAIDAFQTAKLSVPRDVSVVGFDGVAGNDRAAHLTTVEVPLSEIGAEAVKILLRQIEADAVSIDHHTLTTRLRNGKTTAAISPK